MVRGRQPVRPAGRGQHVGTQQPPGPADQGGHVGGRVGGRPSGQSVRRSGRGAGAPPRSATRRASRVRALRLPRSRPLSGGARHVHGQCRAEPEPGRRVALLHASERAGLVDDVERCLGDPAEPGEAGVGDDLADRRLAGLRAEREPPLGERVRDAEERREAVVDAADRVEVVRDRVAGGGLDDHPGAVRGERPRMCRAAPSGSPMSCRQSNVVTRSYGPRGKFWALADLEPRAVASPASAARLRAGRRNPRGSPSRRIGSGTPGHQEGRAPWPQPTSATDAPRSASPPPRPARGSTRRAGAGSRAEEPLAAGEHVVVVLVPADPPPVRNAS